MCIESSSSLETPWSVPTRMSRFFEMDMSGCAPGGGRTRSIIGMSTTDSYFLRMEWLFYCGGISADLSVANAVVKKGEEQKKPASY